MFRVWNWIKYGYCKRNLEAPQTFPYDLFLNFKFCSEFSLLLIYNPASPSMFSTVTCISYSVTFSYSQKKVSLKLLAKGPLEFQGMVVQKSTAMNGIQANMRTLHWLSASLHLVKHTQEFARGFSMPFEFVLLPIVCGIDIPKGLLYLYKSELNDADTVPLTSPRNWSTYCGLDEKYSLSHRCR